MLNLAGLLCERCYLNVLRLLKISFICSFSAVQDMGISDKRILIAIEILALKFCGNKNETLLGSFYWDTLKSVKDNSVTAIGMLYRLLVTGLHVVTEIICQY